MTTSANELHSRKTFSLRLSRVVDEIIDKTLEDSELSDETKAEARRAGWVALTGNETTKGHRVPCSVLGADEIEIDSAAPVGMDTAHQDDGYYVTADLYQDGSPYVLESDIDLVRPTEKLWPSRYAVFASPETPPTAVHRDLLVQVSEKDPYSLSTMNQVVTTFGSDALHRLTALEGQSLLDAVQLSADAASTDEFRAMFGF